ncbi:MAG: AAA family ATPase, partial [Tissierellales bacterium]
MGRIISIFNQKGGVGKTTSVVNLAAALGRLNKKVLVVDIDPQGNATSGLGVDKNSLQKSIYNVMIDNADIKNIIYNTTAENVFIVPSNVELAGAEIELIEKEDRELVLKKALKDVKNSYDIIFIDCPPSLGLLSINGLTASDSVIIPIQCEYYALEGVS